MNVPCERSKTLAVAATEVAGAVQSTLARGQPSYAYQVTYVSDDRLQFRAAVRPNRWWVMPTTLLIRLEPEGQATTITVSIDPPARVPGDVLDFCQSMYFRGLLTGVRQLLALPGNGSQTHERLVSRWAIAMLIFRTFGFFVLSVLIGTALLIQLVIFPSSDPKPLLAVFGILLAARLIRSLVFWLNWWSDPQNAKLPRSRSGKKSDA